MTVPGKTRHVAKIAIAHLHDSTGHDLAAAPFWKLSSVQFFRYDTLYSPVSAILESRKYDPNTLLRRWAGCPYISASCTSEHVRFVKNQLTHIHELQGVEYQRRKSQVRTKVAFSEYLREVPKVI